MKKNPELVKQEANKLYQEIINNGYSEKLAKEISDELSTKGGYLFNSSHAYSYAVLCFQTAYLKSKYPINFFKALFNLNKDKSGMLNKYIIDANGFNVEVSPPNINKSERNFSIYNEKILFGLSAISGIGDKVVDYILEKRNEGSFKNFDDLIKRVSLSNAQIISLVKSGAIPTKNKKKFLEKYLMSSYEPIKFSEVATYKTKKEMIDTWGINVDDYKVGNKIDKNAVLNLYNKKRKEIYQKKEEERYQNYLNEISEKYLINELFWEVEALQIFINDNPFTEGYKYLSSQFEDVENGNKCTIIGIITKIQKKKDKNKKQFAYVNIYSTFGIVEAIVWHSTLKQHEDLIKKGNQIALLCKKDSEDKVIAEDFRDYSEWLAWRKGKYERKIFNE